MILSTKAHNIQPEISDERFHGSPLEITFHGRLRPGQQAAVETMLEGDLGVLAAATGFGKTVIAAYLIAERKVNTLVLVHRRQLVDQWIVHLRSFLGLSSDEIGRIGGGKREPSGIIDVATIQSLHRKGSVDDLVGEYGHLIVDECHHISARSFELVVRQSKARYVTGLSATETRKDGHHPIIFMQCGPVRYRVVAREQASKRPFQHRVIKRRTDFVLDGALTAEQKPSIQKIYKALSDDTARNEMIVEDILAAVVKGKYPVVLTERRDHLDELAARLRPNLENVFVLKGGLGKKMRRKIEAQLEAVPAGES